MEVGPAEDRTREALILRIVPKEGAGEKSAHEFAVMKQLYAAGYPVPRVLWLETEGVCLDRPFVIMERIVGRSLGAIVEAAPREARRGALARFCRMFVELHALDWRPFAPDPGLCEREMLFEVFARQRADMFCPLIRFIL